MADPSGLMVVLLLLLSEGLVARWGGGGLDSSGSSNPANSQPGGVFATEECMLAACL